MTAETPRWLGDLSRELSDLREAHRLRSLKEGTGRLDFASNDYLSLNADGRLEGMLRELAGEWKGPVGSTGSRLIRGHHSAFDRAQDAFARYTGHSAALLFHSGYAANVGTLQALLTNRDRVFCDRLCHASLLDGIRMSGARRHYFAHNDLDDLARQLDKYSRAAGKGDPRGRDWIVSETLFSMDGDSPDLPAMAEIAEAKGALLYLDEAHAVGVLGPGGAGLVTAANLTERVAVTVYPCGKAPGLMGAVVCGAPELRDYLINRARSFIFSTAQPPLLAALLADVIELLGTDEMEARRRKLKGLGDDLRARLKAGGLDTGASSAQIVPVILGSEERALRVAAACAEAGMDARAIRPPSVPADGSRLRITLQANHSTEDIRELAELLLKTGGD